MQQSQYRADIDGLRAIAVLAVVFTHTHLPGFPGGYVGVDVFFVISGFLITSILLKEISEERFSIVRFYERRIRRIFPALFPVIAFCVVAGLWLLPAQALEDMAKSIIATTLFGSNILFWREAGYFDVASVHKPLLHTWSLAVEEQFYILFPVFLIIIHRYLRNKYLLSVLLIWMISFFVNIWGVRTYSVPTFYLAPPRSWELLSGSILALGFLPELKSKISRHILSLIGLGLVLYGIFRYNENTLFPGYAAVLPVAGASIIIYTGIGGRGVVNNILSIKPLVFIGLISYSLYLWHWPIIVFFKFMMFDGQRLLESVAIIMTSITISVLSWRYIESPFRKKNPVFAERKKIFSYSLAVVLVSLTGGVIIIMLKGIPSRYPDAEATHMSYKNDLQWIHFSDNVKILDDIKNGSIPPVIGELHSNNKPCFVLWGDSHAGSLVTGVSQKAAQYGLSGYNISHDYSVRPLLGMDVLNDNYALNEADYNRAVIEFIKSHPEINTVILAGYWSNEKNLKDVTGEYATKTRYELLLRAGLFRTVAALNKLGRHVLLVSDIPTLKADPNELLYISKRIGRSPDFSSISPSVSEYLLCNKNVAAIMNELVKAYNVAVIHPESFLFDKSGRTIIMNKEKMYYMDVSHLSTEGSASVAPAFDPVFRAISAGYK